MPAVPALRRRAVRAAAPNFSAMQTSWCSRARPASRWRRTTRGRATRPACAASRAIWRSRKQLALSVVACGARVQRNRRRRGPVEVHRPQQLVGLLRKRLKQRLRQPVDEPLVQFDAAQQQAVDADCPNRQRLRSDTRRRQSASAGKMDTPGAAVRSERRPAAPNAIPARVRRSHCPPGIATGRTSHPACRTTDPRSSPRTSASAAAECSWDRPHRPCTIRSAARLVPPPTKITLRPGKSVTSRTGDRSLTTNCTGNNCNSASARRPVNGSVDPRVRRRTSHTPRRHTKTRRRPNRSATRPDWPASRRSL